MLKLTEEGNKYANYRKGEGGNYREGGGGGGSVQDWREDSRLIILQNKASMKHETRGGFALVSRFAQNVTFTLLGS